LVSGETKTGIDFPRLRDQVRWLRGEDGVVPESEAISVLATVLGPLLSLEGFNLSLADSSQDSGFDLLAFRAKGGSASALAVGVEYKHRGGGRPIDVAQVRQLARVNSLSPFDRVLLIGRFGFTPGAIELARQLQPVSIELLDLADVEGWIDRVESGSPDNAKRIELLIRSISHEFAQLVASDAEALDHLEWRDLERLMARVMEGIGFDVTLTPPSKDGGKDLVLSCVVSNRQETFAVEIKHWRTGKKVGGQAVTDFLQVVIEEKRTAGLLLSTSGYSPDASQGLTEISRQRLRLGSRSKIVLLAQQYIRANSGLWSPDHDLPDVLFEATE